MPYARRDAAGAIVALSADRSPETPEAVAPDDPTVRAFARATGLSGPAAAGADADPLSESDREMSRVVEDLIDLLIRKGVVSPGELPPSARRKLTRRQTLRGQARFLADIVGEEKLI